MVTETGNWARDRLSEDAMMQIARHCETAASTLAGYPDLAVDMPKFRAVAEAIFALYVD